MPVAAHFHGGPFNPTPPGGLQYLVTNEGGWSEPQTPKAIEYAGYVYVGSVSGQDGDVVVVIRSPSGSATTKVMHAALGGEGTADMHDNASVIVRDSDHKLMVFYCRHADSNVRLRISNSSLDADPTCANGFTSETLIDVNTTVIDYPMIHQLTGEANDPIYLMFRSTSGSTARWLVCKSTDGGSTWSNNQWVYRNTGFTTYLQSTSNGIDRIDFVAQNKNETEASPNTLHHGYYEGGSFFKSDGTNVGSYPLASPLTPTDLTEVSSGIGHHLFVIERDDSSGDIAVMTSEVGSDRSIRRCYWNGSAWSQSDITTSEAPYSYGNCVDPADLDVVYTSKWVSGTAELFRYTWNGASWDEEALTSASAFDWLWPQPVRNGSACKIIVMYGTYTTYTNYLADIYVLAT